LRKSETSAGYTGLTCDVDDQRITIAEIASSNENFTFKSIRQFPRSATGTPEAQKFIQSLTECGFSSKKIRISMRGYGVVVRFIQFPKMKPEDLKSALAFEAEKFIPFKAADVVFDYCILDPNGGGGEASKEMSLLLVAIKREEIYPILEQFRLAHLEPELVDVNALALLNSIGYLCPESNDDFSGMLDISTTISTLTIARKGIPCFIRDISFGETDIAKRLKLLLGVNDAKLSEILAGVGTAGSADVHGAIKEAIKGLCADLKISLNYFIEHNHLEQPISKLFLGGRWNTAFLADILSSILSMKVQPTFITPKVSIDESLPKELLEKTLGLMPILVGLAIRKI
jgi:type IV pilus assembly protein PilM